MCSLCVYHCVGVFCIDWRLRYLFTDTYIYIYIHVHRCTHILLDTERRMSIQGNTLELSVCVQHWRGCPSQHACADLAMSGLHQVTLASDSAESCWSSMFVKVLTWFVRVSSLFCLCVSSMYLHFISTSALLLKSLYSERLLFQKHIFASSVFCPACQESVCVVACSAFCY